MKQREHTFMGKRTDFHRQREQTFVGKENRLLYAKRTDFYMQREQSFTRKENRLLHAKSYAVLVRGIRLVVKGYI